jgi:transposase
MTKHTREKWAARVREWRASGKSAEDFCADKDYKAASLRWAASQVGDGSAERVVPKPVAPVTQQRPRRPASKPTAPRFAPVRVRRSAPTVAEVVVEVCGARIRVGRGVDMTLLGDVVRALQGGAR